MRQIDMEGIGHFVHSNGDETPNFHSVLASTGKGLVYEFSEEKPVLQTGDQKRKLGSSELHSFPYCVSCEGNMLKLSVHHSITDGYGTTEFVKTLLYY